MRLLYRPTVEQRAALQERLTRLRRPGVALELLNPILPRDLRPVDVECTDCSVHPDRFVVRARLRSSAGDERDYALKGYSDDFHERVWRHARALAGYQTGRGDGFCLPIHHLPRERMLIFPWVSGVCLTDVGDDRAPALLQRTAALAAGLHRLPIVPEPPTTPAMILDEVRDRCRRVSERWPAAVPIVAPLLAELEEAATGLDPGDPAPVHGDLDAGQTLWTGKQLVVIDLDMFGYTDPAYDVGHFLAQLARRHVPSHWVAAFRDAYLAAAPSVSPRNVSFYCALTLVRKIHTVCRLEPAGWPVIVPPLAAIARAALGEAAAAGQVR